MRPIADAEATAQTMRSVMCAPLAWCPDLPLEIEIKIMPRYSK